METVIVNTSTELITGTSSGPILPAIIADAGDQAGKRFIEFFTATIRNGNTRRAYARAVGDFFAWCERHGLTLTGIEPVHVAAYIEQLTQRQSRPHRQAAPGRHRHAVRLADQRRHPAFNPAASVRGPKHVVKRGKTPVLTADEARQLLDSIAA